MSASHGLATASDAHAIRLRYTLTSEETAWVLAQAVPLRENKLLHFAAVAGGACMAIYCATLGVWSGAAVFGTATIASLTRYSGHHSLIRFVFRGEVDHDLIVDRDGIRGTLNCTMRIKRWSTTTEIEYRWQELKSMLRLGDYLWLEFPKRNVFGFNMPTGAIIPMEAFANTEDLQQCEAWAEHGLSQQGGSVA